MKNLILFFLLCASAWATTVTGTVVDPNGNPYANGTASATTVVASGQASTSTTPVATSGSGAFSLVLNPATYIFTICAPPSQLGPRANPTPQQVCFMSAPIAVSGGSLNISTQLNALAAILGPKLTVGAGSGLVIGPGGTTPPSPLATSACPSGEAVFDYGLNGSGNYQDLESWNTSGTPPTPAGQITFCWPFQYNDSGVSIHPNRAFTVTHTLGNGGLQANSASDESAFMGIMNNLGVGQSVHQFLTFYGEADLSGSTLTFGAHAGGEASVSVFRGNHTNAASSITGGGGFWVFSGQYEHDGASVPTTTGVYHAYLSSNGGSGNQGGQIVRGYNCQGGFAGTETNYSAACFAAALTQPRYPTNNYGFLSQDFGNNANDFDMVLVGANANTGASGFNAIYGPTTFGKGLAQASAGLQLDIAGGGVAQTQTDTSTGNLENFALSATLNPGATKTGNVNMLDITQSSSVTQALTGRIRGILITLNPQSTSATAIARTEGVNVGNFPTGTHDFGLTIAGLFDAESVATAGTDSENDAIRAQSGAAGSGGTITNDYTFQAPAPSTTGTMTHHYGLWLGNHSQNPGGRNPDGWGIFDSASNKWQVGRLFTPSPCASSSGTCGAAIAGSFTIAAAATTATVSTTSVNADSKITITEKSTLGGALGVTCNTSTGRTYSITTITGGTSFVVTTSAAPVTNPACLTFSILD